MEAALGFRVVHVNNPGAVIMYSGPTTKRGKDLLRKRGIRAMSDFGLVNMLTGHLTMGLTCLLPWVVEVIFSANLIDVCWVDQF